jgi:hypothetical protein
MSRQIGLDTVFLRPTPRIAHTEYSLNYHTSLFKDSVRELHDAWDLDFLWCTNDGPIDWCKAGRCTDMGHGEYASDGGDRRDQSLCPFGGPEEVHEFDPLREYDLPSRRELVRSYEECYRKLSDSNPNQLVTGGYYKTLISGAVQAFGWDMLLQAAADEDRFAQVLERLARYTLQYNLAWAETSIEAFIQHDDMVWTQGPFLRPDFYRRVIFPLYRRLWEPLKRAGKRVIFCSDGTWDMFYDDVAACGADGFCFEPSNNLDAAVSKYGKTHVIIASKVDCRTLTFSPWKQVQAEIDATLPLAKLCPGFIWAVGNHIPANVSDEMCKRYIEYLRAHWQR